MKRNINDRSLQPGGNPVGRRTGIRLGLVLAAAALAISTVASAGQISIPYVFVDGTVAQAAEVNSNFQTLVAESNSQDLRLDALEGGLSLQIVTTKGLAGPGDSDAAAILLAVNSSSGPVSGLDQSDFVITTRNVPPGSYLFLVDSMNNYGFGLYRFQVSPASTGTWNAGRYLFTVRVTTPSGIVSGVGHLDID